MLLIKPLERATKFALTFAFTLIFSLNVVLAEGSDGDRGGSEGGDKGDAAQTIECRADGTDRFPQTGRYLLDYALETNDNPMDWYIVENNPKAHLQKIKQKLESELPIKFGKTNFYDFKGIEEEWLSTEGFSLQETESFDHYKITPNCDKATIKQIVTYRNKNIYVYDPVQLKQLVIHPELQISLLQIHELNRKIYSRTSQVLNWTRILHDKRFFTYTGIQFRMYLLLKGVLTESEIAAEEFFIELPKNLTIEDYMTMARELVDQFAHQSAKIENYEEVRLSLKNETDQCLFMKAKITELKPLNEKSLTQDYKLSILEDIIIDLSRGPNISSKRQGLIIDEFYDHINHQFREARGTVKSVYDHFDYLYNYTPKCQRVKN